jgi:hypothetical protein
VSRDWRKVLIGRSCTVKRNAAPPQDSSCKGRSCVEGAARNVRTAQAQVLSLPICVRTGELSISLVHQIRASTSMLAVAGWSWRYPGTDLLRYDVELVLRPVLVCHTERPDVCLGPHTHPFSQALESHL